MTVRFLSFNRFEFWTASTALIDYVYVNKIGQRELTGMDKL